MHMHLVSTRWQLARSSGSSRKLQISSRSSAGSATMEVVRPAPSCLLVPDAILPTLFKIAAHQQSIQGICRWRLRDAIWCNMLPCAPMFCCLHQGLDPRVHLQPACVTRAGAC